MLLSPHSNDLRGEGFSHFTRIQTAKDGVRVYVDAKERQKLLVERRYFVAQEIFSLSEGVAAFKDSTELGLAASEKG